MTCTQGTIRNTNVYNLINTRFGPSYFPPQFCDEYFVGCFLLLLFCFYNFVGFCCDFLLGFYFLIGGGGGQGCGLGGFWQGQNFFLSLYAIYTTIIDGFRMIIIHIIRFLNYLIIYTNTEQNEKHYTHYTLYIAANAKMN